MFRIRCCLLANVDLHSAYKVLGVSAASSIAEVKTKYLQLAKRFHPDLNSGDDTQMKAINIAYEAITEDVAKRHHETRKAPTGTGKSFAEKYGRKKQRAARSSSSDHSAWTTKTEFDWINATGSVTEREATDARNHPHTFNKNYSWEDDLAIFREVRSGASVSQVARFLGKTPLAIEQRLNSAQFKQRMQIQLRREKRKRGPAMESTDPIRRTAVRRASGATADSAEDDGAWTQHPLSDDMGFRTPRDADLWSADQVVSPMGKSYSNFVKFSGRRKPSTSL